MPASGGAAHLDELVLLRRARDRMDRDDAQPLDVEALARGAHMSAGHFSRRFKAAYGEPPYDGTFARLRAGDAEVVQEPTDQPYGVRDCSFRDPAGTLIRIQEVR